MRPKMRCRSAPTVVPIWFDLPKGTSSHTWCGMRRQRNIYGLNLVKVIIYAEGGSRGNPGVAGSGIVLYAADGSTILDEIAYVVGKKSTNNVAEYYGLLRGVERAAELGATEVEFYMDSKLVVEQINGRWKIKHPDMQKLALEAKKVINS